MSSASRQDGRAGRPVSPAAPKEPGSTFFLWSGIIGAASGSLFFNLYHDSALLPMLLAVVAGFLPPFMSVVLGHAVKDVDQLWTKIGVFVVTICSMAVSAQGSSQVLLPALGEWGSYLLPITLDGADLILLFALIQHYEHACAYEAWLAAQAGNRAEAPRAAVPPALGTALIPEPGTSPAVPGTGTGPLVPPPAVAPAGTGTVAPALGTTGTGMVPGAGTAAPVPPPAVPAPPAVVPAPVTAAGTTPKPAGPKKPAGTQRSATLELCQRVVDEFAAAHPRPPVEDAEQLKARAAMFLTEFREKTGERANNHEMGRALHIHPKRQVPSVRAAVSEPEGERPADQPAEGEERTA